MGLIGRRGDARLHQPPRHVEVHGQQRVVVEHQRLRLLQRVAPLRRVRLACGRVQQCRVFGARPAAEVLRAVARHRVEEGRGVVVVRGPADADDVPLRRIRARRQIGLEFHLDEFGLDAERFLPHRGDGDADLLHQLVLVVEEPQAQRSRRRIARFCIQPAGTRHAFVRLVAHASRSRRACSSTRRPERVNMRVPGRHASPTR